MTAFTEGSLEISFNNVLNATKFEEHGFSAMKAVDFLVELPDRYLFIEFKDPEQRWPNTSTMDYADSFKSGKMDQDLKYKFRDSFLHRWAEGYIDKPTYYYVLVAVRWLSTADLSRRTSALRQSLPIGTPSSWVRSIATDCAVFNIETWNRSFPNLPVERVP